MDGHRAPRFHATGYTVLRGDNDGRLTVEAVRQHRWSLRPGSRQIVALVGVRYLDGGAGSLLGRVMAEAGVSDCYVQARPDVANQLAAEAAVGATQLLRVQ
jgi:hypothetical protein